MDFLWRIALFDGPRLSGSDGGEVRRFRSQRVAALLAYLALRLGRDCPREELAAALWPEEEFGVTSKRLRVTLTSLRHQLELPGMTPGSVLDASRFGYVRLRAETVWCDVAAFESALRRGARSEAAALAQGPLLPGFFDEWILTERERLEALREGLPAPETQAPPVSLPDSQAPPERSLPVYLTRFFGRETERELLSRMLQTERLVSLLGPGGVGKSRLSVELARAWESPCALVALANLTDSERLAEFVLSALRVPSRTNEDLAQTLGNLLARRGRFLLILDNAEHVLEAVATLVPRLLEAAPELTILVTTRQGLNMVGEHTVVLEPLDPPMASASAERLLEFPAVALFVDRARSVRPDFALTAHHTDAIVSICRRVDGLPLAIELAAAQTRTKTPTQLATALDDTVLSLASSLKGIPERHRSLRSVIQSSVALLSPELCRFFFALSVFQGGWSSEAAELITQCPQADTFLSELVQCSLVTVHEDERLGRMRFGFLEPLRQFAAEQCDETMALSAQHTLYFLNLAAPAANDDIRCFDPLESELENLERALKAGWEGHRDSAFWAGLTGFLAFAFIRGHQRRAALWAEKVSEHWQTIDDPECRFAALNWALGIYFDAGRFTEAQASSAAMLTQARALNQTRWAIHALLSLGFIATSQGDTQGGQRLEQEALAEARALGAPAPLIRALLLTARASHFLAISLQAAEPERARTLFQEAESANQEALALMGPHSVQRAFVHLGLFLSLAGQNRNDEAYTHLKACQYWASKHQSQALLMYSFWHESSVEVQWGTAEQAALLYGAFRRLREQMNYAADLGELERERQAALRAALGEDAYSSQLRLASQLPLETIARPRTWAELIAQKTMLVSPQL